MCQENCMCWQVHGGMRCGIDSIAFCNKNQQMVVCDTTAKIPNSSCGVAAIGLFSIFVQDNMNYDSSDIGKL